MKCLLCGFFVVVLGLGVCCLLYYEVIILFAKATLVTEVTTSSASISTAVPTEELTTLNPAAPSLMPQGAKYELELAVDGFQKPIYLTYVGDGSGCLFVVEQVGVIWIF